MKQVVWKITLPEPDLGNRTLPWFARFALGLTWLAVLGGIWTLSKDSGSFLAEWSSTQLTLLYALTLGFGVWIDHQLLRTEFLAIQLAEKPEARSLEMDSLGLEIPNFACAGGLRDRSLNQGRETTKLHWDEVESARYFEAEESGGQGRFFLSFRVRGSDWAHRRVVQLHARHLTSKQLREVLERSKVALGERLEGYASEFSTGEDESPILPKGLSPEELRKRSRAIVLGLPVGSFLMMCPVLFLGDTGEGLRLLVTMVTAMVVISGIMHFLLQEKIREQERRWAEGKTSAKAVD